MAVPAEDVQTLAQGLLGRNIAPEFLEQFTEFEDLPAVYDAMYNSPEGKNFRETGVAASLDNPGVLPTGQTETQAVTAADVQQIYQDELGRGGADNFIQGWVDSGMSLADIRQAVNDSPEGQNFDSTGLAASLDNPGVLPGPEGTFTNLLDTTQNVTNPPVNYSPLITQYYQELFNRDPQQAGLDYFTGRLGSGALTEEGLRDAIIAGAQGSDRLYYDASQSGGPVFDATQALFGRRPARGRFNPETGQLEGGFGQYRSQLDAGDLTEDQLRTDLVNLAYRRGEGGGSSADYQAYLDSLGINRGGRPFLQDDGTYANIPYGGDLSQYRRTYGDRGQFPDFPFGGRKGGGMYQRPDGSYGGGGGIVGKGGGGMPGRMPGQYITGNQLYSGLPFGMTQPMGMMNFMQPMMQPTIYQPPQLSQQYMPNRGLMSGYSTGFGPYGGYRRPRFGGGKGGPRIMRPMGGKGGFGF